MQHAITLRTAGITLRPLDPEADAAAVRALTDPALWAGMSKPLPADDAAMAEHLRSLADPADTLAFAVLQAPAGGAEGEASAAEPRLVGVTTFYDVVPGLKAEIGNTFYAREVWGTRVNPAAKLLMLGHAFGPLGVERAALRCDHRNTRSHQAILRLGARFEGTLRRFRPAADGTVADVDYFSILREEWPEVRAGLEERLRRDQA